MSNNIYGQKIVHCKSCHSNKIQLVGNLYYMVSAALFLTTFLLIWIPIIGWLAMPFTLISSIILLIIGIFNKRYRVKCSSCNNGFNISKKDYLALKQYFK